MFKRIFALILALVLFAAPLLGGVSTVSAASADDMEATIEKQVRAFADSIDKSNADDEAALALASHGMSGRGKKLSVGKTHALTATLFNSELLQVALIDCCAAAIKAMQQLSMEKLTYIRGDAQWYGSGNSSCQMRVYDSLDSEKLLDWSLTDRKYPSERNAYDKSLDWMAGTAAVDMELTRTKATADTQTYKVSITVWDRFDFSTSSNSGFNKLISGLGAVMFREFDWEAKVTLELEVPYECSHSSGVYRWSYDPENQTITSDGTNAVTRHTHETEDGTISYYYELENPVQLRHDRPWVMEYDVQKPGTFVLSPLNSSSTSQLHFMIHRRSYLAVSKYERVNVSEELKEELGLSSVTQSVRHYHGLALSGLFKYSSKKIYTYRLENQLNPDGSNMIYLTMRDAETGEILVDRIPMDDYYRYESWIKEYVLMDENEDWISGKDLNFSYIGNNTNRFSAGQFDLRVWENGEDGAVYSYYEKSAVAKPTCTAQGYTTYTCSCCGYSYKGDKVKAAGHSYGEWEEVTPATCTDSGEEQRKCKNCDVTETREISATGHNYENHVCTNCGDMLYILGDVDMSGTIDVDDVLALLWNVLFPEEYPIEVPADFDGSGTTDVDDVLTLLWHVLFPEEYPLQ